MTLQSFEIDPAFAERKWGPGRAVGMNAHAEVAATARVYTVGLDGCRCTVAKRGDVIQLAHYCVSATSHHVAALHAFRPDSVALWVQGVWVKRAGVWETEPEAVPFELRALCHEVCEYSTCASVDQMLDYNAGRLIAPGVMPMLNWAPGKQPNHEHPHSPQSST